MFVLELFQPRQSRYRRIMRGKSSPFGTTHYTKYNPDVAGQRPMVIPHERRVQRYIETLAPTTTGYDGFRGTVRVLRIAGTLGGFFEGFLVLAGVYGFVFSERLVEQGLASMPTAYLVSATLVGTGTSGLYLQRYIK